MNIRISQNRRETVFEALSDFCGEATDISKTIDFLTPQAGN